MQKNNDLASLVLDFTKKAATLLAAKSLSNQIEQNRHHVIALVKLDLLRPNSALIRQDFIEMQENNAIFWPILKLQTKNQVFVL